MELIIITTENIYLEIMDIGKLSDTKQEMR